MSYSRYLLVSHVCLGWSATGDPGEKVLPGVDGLAAPKRSCSVDILNTKLRWSHQLDNIIKIERNCDERICNFLTRPKSRRWCPQRPGRSTWPGTSWGLAGDRWDSGPPETDSAPPTFSWNFISTLGYSQTCKIKDMSGVQPSINKPTHLYLLENAYLKWSSLHTSSCHIWVQVGRWAWKNDK